MFTEDEVGRIAEDLCVYRKTGMFTEEEEGRIEEV